MNQNTKDISVLLNCDLVTALRVQDLIDDAELIDWSEDSKYKMNKVIREVAKEIGLVSVN
jgi:hypothetical protein